MDPNAITYFGETDARNKKIRFGIKAKDRLKHVYVIGKTGMGKSTLLENMAIQDIQGGNGMAVIDPHGSMAEKLLEYIPEGRIKDVLYFAPFDMEYPVSFNVMEDIGADKRHLVVNGLMSTFEKIWVDAWSARMAYILNNTLLALLEYPGATLLGVNRMLSDKGYRKKVVDNIQDASVKSFWVDEFGKWTEKFIAEAIPAIQNKVGQFTANPLVRNLLGQSQSTFDIRKMMDEKKIIIVNLSKGRVGEGNANLLGSMLITKIYLAAMSRADSNEADLAKLPNFYLYVDEFQSFANKSFADILSEARKYKLNLTIAHQYIEQMEEEVRDAVFGNVGTMITFRVGAFDSEVLEKEFAPTFMAEDLVNLGFTQIYLKLMIDGVSSSPFSATTMGPIARPDVVFRDAVIASSRAQFAKPRAEVEALIHDWHDEGTVREVRPREGAQSGSQSSSQTSSVGEQRSVNQQYQGQQNQNAAQYTTSQQRNSNSRPDVSSRPQERQQRMMQDRPQDRLPEKMPERGLEKAPVILPAAHTPQENRGTHGEETAVDANKMAFMKAAEMLREKEQQKEQPKEEPKEEKASADTPLVSLASLNRISVENKKNPTPENISSLKDALSQMVKKNETQKIIEKPMEKALERPVEKPTEKIAEKIPQQVTAPVEAASVQPSEQMNPRVNENQETVSEKKPEAKPQNESQPQAKAEAVEKQEEKPQSKAEPVPDAHDDKKYFTPHAREVPEEILRELLKMDDPVSH